MKNNLKEEIRMKEGCRIYRLEELESPVLNRTIK